MANIRFKFPSSHKPNLAKRKQRERWNARHPEGRKAYSHLRRGHTHCQWVQKLKEK